ncbi:MAG: transglycosylase domain-containing protein, partial [Bradymonadaceae bacterium]
TVGEIRASVALKSLIAGERAIGALTLSDVELNLHRRADGSLNVDALRENLRRDDDDEEEEADEVASDDDAPSWLRHFGGRFPDVDVHRAAVTLTSDKDDEPWPLAALRTEEAQLRGSRRGGALSSTIVIDHNDAPDHRWQLPDTVEVTLDMRLPLGQSMGTIDFSPRLELGDVGPYPFLRGGLTGVVVDEGPQITLNGLSLGLQFTDSRAPLLDAESLDLRLTEMPRDLKSLRTLEIEARGPTAHISFMEDGGSTIDTLITLLRAPQPRAVISKARSIAEAIARGDEEDEETETEEEAAPATGLRARLADVDWKEVITQYAPQRIDVSNGRILVEDRREHAALERPSERFRLEEISLSAIHRPLKTELVIETGARALGDGGDPRGSADLSLVSNYRTGKLSVDATADAVDLGWVSQLLGPRVADKARGGTFRGRLEIERPSRDGKADFSGLVSLSDGVLYLSPVAEDPMHALTGSYRFEGYFDPRAPIPAPRLIGKGKVSPDSELLDIEPDEDEEFVDDPALPPTRGAFVFTTGVARLGQVGASIKPAFYGVEMARRMPARFDLSVRMEKTLLQDIIEAVPGPIKGPLDGMKMRGSLTWAFDLEVPLYEASQMQWKGDVDLDGFEIAYLPPEVDVFQLTEEFEHTIRDEFRRNRYSPGDPIQFERKVIIPAMRPIPATWLLDNTNLTLEQIDRQRRRRGWPPVPEGGLDSEILRSPEYWLTEHALSKAAPKPWKDEVPTRNTFGWPFGGSQNDDSPERPKMGEPGDPNRYGKYQFVPLHHISPWMPRAIMTTEDNSFYTHRGFNWLAIKQSVQSNLRARDYVRGASTISMQLA